MIWGFENLLGMGMDGSHPFLFLFPLPAEVNKNKTKFGKVQVRH